MRLAIINQSAITPDEHLRLIVSALDVQVNQHLRPLWRTSQVILDFIPRGMQPEPGVWELVVADTSDVKKALGYHTDKGEPRGFVFAKTCLEAGVQLSVTISHELLEMLGDPDTTRTRSYGGVRYAQELCDPVEADQFGYRIGDVLVSDFITPEWFGAAKPGLRYDWLGHLKRPRSLIPGGYILAWTHALGWHQVFVSEQGRQILPATDGEMMGRPGTSGRSLRRLAEMGEAT